MLTLNITYIYNSNNEPFNLFVNGVGVAINVTSYTVTIASGDVVIVEPVDTTYRVYGQTFVFEGSYTEDFTIIGTTHDDIYNPFVANDKDNRLFLKNICKSTMYLYTTTTNPYTQINWYINDHFIGSGSSIAYTYNYYGSFVLRQELVLNDGTQILYYNSETVVVLDYPLPETSFALHCGTRQVNEVGHCDEGGICSDDYCEDKVPSVAAYTDLFQTLLSVFQQHPNGMTNPELVYTFFIPAEFVLECCESVSLRLAVADNFEELIPWEDLRESALNGPSPNFISLINPTVITESGNYNLTFSYSPGLNTPSSNLLRTALIIEGCGEPDVLFPFTAIFMGDTEGPIACQTIDQNIYIYLGGHNIDVRYQNPLYNNQPITFVWTGSTYSTLGSSIPGPIVITVTGPQSYTIVVNSIETTNYLSPPYVFTFFIESITDNDTNTTIYQRYENCLYYSGVFVMEGFLSYQEIFGGVLIDLRNTRPSGAFNHLLITP